jgi:hypothetical protein
MCDWTQLTVETMKELRNSSRLLSFSIDDIFPLFKHKYPLIVIDYNFEKTKKNIERALTSSDLFKKIGDKSYSLNDKKIHLMEKKAADRKKQKNNKKKPLSQWCHQCKQKHNEIVYCSKFHDGSCTKKYCKGCIERHYHESYDNIQKDKWVCLFCRNLCVCAFCRRKRGEDVPKKVLKRKHNKSGSIKESPPSSPKKKIKKTVKTEIKCSEKEEVVFSSPLNSPLNSPISPTIPPNQETKVIINPTIDSIEAVTTLNKVVQSNNINNIVNSTTMNNQINPQSISLEKITNINMDLSLSQLMKSNLINTGDKIVFVQKAIFIGEILEHGNVKLEWCNQVVPNIAAFTERCGIKYSTDCLDSIYCKGETLKKLIISFHEQFPQANITTIETIDFSNFEANYVNLDFMSDDVFDDQPYYDYNELNNDYMDFTRDCFLNNVFEDYDYNSFNTHGDTILTQDMEQSDRNYMYSLTQGHISTVFV